MSFDRIAPFYRSMEWVLAGGKLHRCRTMWLGEVRQAQRILLAGEGHGRFLELCPKRFPGAQIVCVDASAEMLAIAERRWQRSGGWGKSVQFVQATLPDWSPASGGFDLIVTNFFLDCFALPTLPRVIESLSNVAAPRADWLVADFVLPPCGWRRWRAQIVLALAYAFFRRVTHLEARQLVTPDTWFIQAGFRLRRRATVESGLLQSDWWSR